MLLAREPIFKDFDQLFDLISSGRPQKQPEKYPLTDISTDSNGTLYIEIAAAGFSKEDISIELKNGMLIVSGRLGEEEEPSDLTYHLRNIARRAFERRVRLDEKYYTGDMTASMENGILSITVSSREPDRKLISIQ